MDKSKFFCSIIIAVSFFSQINISFAQDSTNSKTSEEEFTALKKGNFAFYLEFGSMLFSKGSYDSDYDLVLTAKYHLTDKTALRVSGGTNIFYETGIKTETASYQQNFKDNRSTFNTTVNIQHFLSLKSKVKPFLGFGIYARYYYNLDNYQNTSYKYENWGIGPYASFGAEYFVVDNISIIGEYIMKGTAGKSYIKYLYFDEYETKESSYEYSTVYKLDFQSFKAGLSIYF